MSLGCDVFLALLLVVSGQYVGGRNEYQDVLSIVPYLYVSGYTFGSACV